MNRYSTFSLYTGLWQLEAYLYSSLRSHAIVITTNERTDRHSSNVLEFRADPMSPRNKGSQMNISMRTTHIDKTSFFSKYWYLRRHEQKTTAKTIFSKWSPKNSFSPKSWYLGRYRLFIFRWAFKNFDIFCWRLTWKYKGWDILI